MKTVKEAKQLIAGRNGRPFEDDWDAVEAGEVLSAQLPHFNLPKVNRKLLESLEVGQSIVVLEADGRKQAGAQCQSYANRANIRISTAACLLLPTSTLGGQRVVVVTRIEEV